MLDICSWGEGGGGGGGGGEEEVEYVYIIHEVNYHVWFGQVVKNFADFAKLLTLINLRYNCMCFSRWICIYLLCQRLALLLLFV